MITKRLILSVFFPVFLVGILSTTAFAQDDLPALSAKIQPSVVTILTYGRTGKPLSTGSGFFVSADGQVITNYHVIQDAYRIKAKIHDGSIIPAEQIEGKDREGDLALITFNTGTATLAPLPVSNVLPQVGEKVIVVGSPLGFLTQTVSEGIVSAVREIPGFGNILQITAPISPGSSGSPVLNMKGEVIGVASAQIIAGQNLNFAIASARVKSLLARIHVQKPKTKESHEDDTAKLTEPESADSARPSEANDPYSKGLQFAFAGEFQKALPFLKEATRKNKDSADGWSLMGFVQEQLKQHREAIETFKQTIRLKPDDANAHWWLGMEYRQLGRYEEAIEAFKEAIRLKPDDAEAHCDLGSAYGCLGRLQESVKAYKEAVRLEPEWAKAYCGLGEAYLGLKRYRESVEAYKQAIRLQPSPDLVAAQPEFFADFIAAHCDLGKAYQGLGLYRDAVEECKQAVKLKPDYARAHYALGITYVCLEDKGLALDEYKILKNLNSELADKLLDVIYK